MRPDRPRAGDILFQPETSPIPSFLRRIAVVVAVILLVAIGMYFTRDGLRDNTHPNREMSFIDVLYFTVISLTTVGYGDIVPESASARFINAVLLTPVRILVLTAFVGTAYEITLQRYRQQATMKQLRERLENHTILCGFAVTGRAIVSELLAHGHTPDSILVIDPDEEVAREVTALGLTALRGNASSEAILHAAALEKAEHVLVAPNNDADCVLICLTVRALHPKVRLVASAREEENIKLLYRAGADVVVSPSLSGGRLMGSAVRQRAVTMFLQDLLVFGEGLDAAEYVVTSRDAGKTAAQLRESVPQLRDAFVLGSSRGEQVFRLTELNDIPLQTDDVVVYLCNDEPKKPMPS